MSEVKFTKGPWSFEHDDSTSSVIQVFSLSDSAKGDPDICRLQHEPDACLISTAPQMYSLLSEAMVKLSFGDYESKLISDDIKSLLEKARGEHV